MTVKRGGLGRNLSVLLGNTPIPPGTNTSATSPSGTTLSIDALQPGKYQPRGDMDEARLEELAQSIRQQGLLQPLVVRPLKDGRHEILAGERRWRACRRAGLTEVPVVIRECDDETAMVIALVENLQREDLNALDEARALGRLTSEFALTHQQVAELVGKSRAAVSNHLRLLTLAHPVQKLLENGDIDMGHARALLMLASEQQAEVATLVIARQLSVRETERLVTRVRDGLPPAASPAKTDLSKAFKAEMQALARALDTRVLLRPGKKGNGTLVIHYRDEARLRDVLERLQSAQEME